MTNWRRVGQFAAAGTIVLCEALLPWLFITRLNHPQPVEPARHLDSLVLADHRLTYAEFAQRAPWAWSLGMVSRSEMERRIDEDIVFSRNMLESSTRLSDGLTQASPYTRAFDNWMPRLTVLIGGL